MTLQKATMPVLSASRANKPSLHKARPGSADDEADRSFPGN